MLAPVVVRHGHMVIHINDKDSALSFLKSLIKHAASTACCEERPLHIAPADVPMVDHSSLFFSAAASIRGAVAQSLKAP